MKAFYLYVALGSEGENKYWAGIILRKLELEKKIGFGRCLVVRRVKIELGL